MIEDVRAMLDSAEGYVYIKSYDKAIELIRNMEDKIRKIDSEISSAPVRWLNLFITFGSMGVIILLMLLTALFFIYSIVTSRKKEFIRKIETSEMKAKRIKAIKEAEETLEEEMKQGLLSKESYEELKKRYEEAIRKTEEEK